MKSSIIALTLLLLAGCTPLQTVVERPVNTTRVYYQIPSLYCWQDKSSTPDRFKPLYPYGNSFNMDKNTKCILNYQTVVLEVDSTGRVL